MATTVRFVRHAQSEGNVGGVFQAPSSPLSELGRRQALAVADRLAAEGCEVVLSSPWERALATAQAIAAACVVPLTCSDLLVERLRPTSIDGARADDPRAADVHRRWEASLAAPGEQVEDGEGYAAIVGRARAVLAFVAARPERDVVVVTHGHLLGFVLAVALLGDAPLDPAAVSALRGAIVLDNTGITTLTVHEERWRLRGFNDVAHLARLGSVVGGGARGLD